MLVVPNKIKQEISRESILIPSTFLFQICYNTGLPYDDCIVNEFVLNTRIFIQIDLMKSEFEGI